MNIYKTTALMALLYGLIVPSAALANNKYWQEFKQFRESASHKLVFDRESPVSGIARSAQNAKEVGILDRAIRPVIGALDGVVITSKDMPVLYGYIDDLCKKNRVDTPVITVTQNKGIFNAAAQKLLMTTGAIIIGQDLLKELDDKGFEAVVAHEIGHIKHNHVNKMLAMSMASLASFIALAEHGYINVQNGFLVKYICWSNCVTALVIGKSFEREADAFACNEADRPAGIVSMSEYLLNKEKKQDADFDEVYDLLRNSYNQMGIIDNVSLWTSYGLTKAGHKMGRGISWFYHNTPFGAHPSHEERVATAKAILAKQVAA
jgi:Zn-dependent protease with chaperone function